MKLWELEEQLQAVRPFESPKVQYEQYMTPAHLAAHALFTADASFGDVQDNWLLDLGCGTGMLSIAAALLGAGYVTAVDVDASALQIAAENAEECEVSHQIDFIQCDIESFARMIAARNRSRSRRAQSSNSESNAAATTTHAEPQSAASTESSVESESESEASRESTTIGNDSDENALFDTAVLNPPFGTRHKGADMSFLHTAAVVCGATAVYSLHKSSTRQHVLTAGESWGFESSVVAELRYNIEQSYAFHKQKSLDIEVDLIRLQKLDSNTPTTSKSNRLHTLTQPPAPTRSGRAKGAKGASSTKPKGKRKK